MNSLYICLLFVCFTICNAGIFQSNQRLCVKGQLKCRTNPENVKQVRVKLYDEDDGPNPDDLMADGYSDDDGHFELCGMASDLWGDIDPVFKVYHDCDDENVLCKRKTKYRIGSQYLGGTYEFADGVDLTMRPSGGEERKCFQMP